jgi:hypothetical protein
VVWGISNVVAFVQMWRGRNAIDVIGRTVVGAEQQTDPPSGRAGKRKGKTMGMKPLSEQLGELSAQSKKMENVVTATRDKNRAELAQQKEALKSSVDAARARVGDTENAAKAHWSKLRDSVDAHFADQRTAAAERKAERDLKRAERRADAAEQDASDAIDFAMNVLDQTEYAIVDAALARADADDLASSGNPR